MRAALLLPASMATVLESGRADRDRDPMAAVSQLARFDPIAPPRMPMPRWRTRRCAHIFKPMLGDAKMARLGVAGSLPIESIHPISRKMRSRSDCTVDGTTADERLVLSIGTVRHAVKAASSRSSGADGTRAYLA